MPSGCFFCSLPATKVIAANGEAMALRDGYPVSPGHTLVQRHFGEFSQDLFPGDSLVEPGSHPAFRLFIESILVRRQVEDHPDLLRLGKGWFFRTDPWFGRRGGRAISES